MDQETFPFIILPASLHLWFHHLENGAKDEKQTDQRELQQNLDSAAPESVEEQPRSWQEEEKWENLKQDYEKVKNHRGPGCCPIPP